ncbi:dynein axonemal light chain 4 isoform X3 [Chelonoidis abingdonii]|nr:dynein light chain 4, axonemal isoform X3 [Chelonoidis abingdonii]
MPEEMRVEAMELCVTACEKYATNNESAAKMIKETMDKKFGSSWHVVIGWPFGTGHVKDPAPLSQTVTGAKSAFLHFSPTLWDKNMTAELPGCEKKVTT